MRLFLILSGFLCGGIMFCKIIPKLVCDTDLCAVSSDGNPGAANAFKHCGIMVGFCCLLLDMLKGFIPVFLARNFVGDNAVILSLIMAAPVLGHAVSPFDKGKGGKCIATSFGVLLGLLPENKIVFILAAIYIFFSVVIKINPHRKRSIITFILFTSIACPLLVVAHKIGPALGCLAVSAITIIKHIRPEQIFQPQQIPEELKKPLT